MKTWLLISLFIVINVFAGGLQFLIGIPTAQTLLTFILLGILTLCADLRKQEKDNLKPNNQE